MVSGGARARSGPPADPNALRRERDKADWIRLPATGRAASAPQWPLARPTPRKLALWTALWQRPEAVMWEAHDSGLQVALYVNAVVAADHPKATAADRRTALSYMDDLGISEGGRARNRWLIDTGPAESQQVTTPNDPDRSSAKARFRTIEGGAAP